MTISKLLPLFCVAAVGAMTFAACAQETDNAAQAAARRALGLPLSETKDTNAPATNATPAKPAANDKQAQKEAKAKAKAEKAAAEAKAKQEKADAAAKANQEAQAQADLKAKQAAQAAADQAAAANAAKAAKDAAASAQPATAQATVSTPPAQSQPAAKPKKEKKHKKEKPAPAAPAVASAVAGKNLGLAPPPRQPCPSAPPRNSNCKPCSKNIRRTKSPRKSTTSNAPPFWPRLDPPIGLA